MIKGITLAKCFRSATDFERLTSFFTALGLEPSKSWQDSASNRRFVAPLGSLELIDATQNTENTSKALLWGTSGDVIIEVTSLDSVRQVAETWIKANPSRGVSAPTEIAHTDWEARIFTASPLPDYSVAFWEWNDPLKGKPLAIEGDLSAKGMRFAVVVARWNAVITDRLLQGSLDALHRSGAKKADVEILRVPGAWEIPSAARKLAVTGDFDAIITLGVLLRGETAHYEAIYTEVSRGIGQSQEETGIPHAFGVLTCETLEQALDRAGLKAGNKGFESACAAIEMASLHRKIDSRNLEECRGVSGISERRQSRELASTSTAHDSVTEKLRSHP
jgi:6,7-dimethyl-8-ribityllumazine synthase